MIDKFIDKRVAEDIFLASMASGIVEEKCAGADVDSMEKSAIDVLGALKDLLSGGKALVESTPKLIMTGIGVGALGGAAYNSIKERMTEQSPEENFNSKLEALYANKKKELENAAWMTRVRNMRDDLKRNHKKMSAEEYAAKYKALEDALDERKA